MKVTEKKLDDNLLQLDVVATPEDVEKAYQMAYLAFAQQMNLRRDGDKSIPQVAEEQLGLKDIDSVVGPQINDFLIPFALDKKNVIPAYPPKNAAASTQLRKGSSYSFSVQVALKPEYELSSYEPVSITIPQSQLNDAEVENQLAEIAERYADYQASDPRPVGEGDSCLLAIEATLDGKPMEGLNTEGRTYTTKAGLMPDDFDDAVIGMNVGETKTFTFEGPGLDDNGQPKMDEVKCTVTVKELQKKVIPAVTDEFVTKYMPMYKNLEELKADIRNSLERRQSDETENMKRAVAVDELSKRFQGRIADEVYEATRENMIMNIRTDLEQQGEMTFDEFVEKNGGADQFGMMMMMQVRQTLIQGYSLDAVFRHEKLKLNDEDILEACRIMNPQQPEMVRQQMEETGRWFAIRELAERIKANKWIVDHANITVESN